MNAKVLSRKVEILLRKIVNLLLEHPVGIQHYYQIEYFLFGLLGDFYYCIVLQNR
jgi:hypothetical protein